MTMTRPAFQIAVAALFVAGALNASFAHAQESRASGGNSLPDGEGRDIVAVACSQCHGLNAFTWLRQGAQAWRHQVYDMILRGTQISPSEMDTVVSYLATSFGPGVNVPQSGAVALPDGPAKEIVEGSCGLCHGIDRAVGAKRTKREWEGTVARMVFLGAPLTDDQAKAASDYLSANFGSGAKTAAAK
jgi:mono/diheme cytochrome c family protein